MTTAPVVPEVPVPPVVPTAPVVPEVPEGDLGDAGKKALDAERDARKASDRRTRQLETELDALKKSSMTDSEKLIADAKDAGRAEASATFGTRLVKSEFIAQAAKHNPAFDTAKILDDLNLARYVDDDGEPDTKAIAEAVTRLVPAAGGTIPQSLDLGTRTIPATKTGGMSDLIRKGAGRA